MSIRAIAKDFYTCQSRVHKLEDQLESAIHNEKEKIKEELRIARAELKILKNMIDGRKAQSLKTKSFPFKTSK